MDKRRKSVFISGLAEGQTVAEFYCVKAAKESLAKMEARLRELDGGFRPGLIARLEGKLKFEQRREEVSKRPRVRIVDRYWKGDDEYAFLKKTPKRIYIVNLSSLSEEHFDIQGKARYGGNIHPEDVEKILAGELK